MWFPTADQIEKIHDEILADGGGSPGVLRRGAIQGALERAQWGPFSEGDLAERAAFLIRGIAQEHPFVDGNKRTAFEAADVFLRQNGYELEVDQDDLVEQALEVAQGSRSLAEIADWIRQHMEKR